MADGGWHIPSGRCRLGTHRLIIHAHRRAEPSAFLHGTFVEVVPGVPASVAGAGVWGLVTPDSVVPQPVLIPVLCARARFPEIGRLQPAHDALDRALTLRPSIVPSSVHVDLHMRGPGPSGAYA